MHLNRQAVVSYSLKIPVSRQQQLSEQSFQQLRPALPCIRTGQQRQHRMRLIAAHLILQDHRQGSGCLCDQPDRTKPYRIGRKPCPRQRHHIARRPGNTTGTRHRQHTSRGRGLRLNHGRIRLGTV